MYKTQYFQNYVSFLNEFFKNLKNAKVSCSYISRYNLLKKTVWLLFLMLLTGFYYLIKGRMCVPY